MTDAGITCSRARSRSRERNGTKVVKESVRIPAPLLRLATDDRAVLGVIQIATDMVMDLEGSLLVSNLPQVTIRHAKIAFDAEEICADTYERAYDSGAIKAAVASLRWPEKNKSGGDYTTMWGISCTSMSFILGDRLKSCFPEGAPLTNMWQGVLQALRAVGAKKLAVLTPYIEAVSQKNEQLLAEEGFEIVASVSLGLTRDLETTAVPPEYLAECSTLLAARGEVDAVFIGCSAFRACMPNFISQLEEKLGGPCVITSTQAFLWHMLRCAGIRDPVQGYGRLFAKH